MINLLPPQEKRRLAQEEIQRMIIIWGFVIAAFLASFTMAILFTATQVNWRVDVQELLLDGLRKELEDSSTAKLRKELVDANRLLSDAEPLLDGGRVSGIFDLIAVHLPQGVYITGLSYSDSPGTLNLEGFSPTRNALLAFKSSLEEDSFFSVVEFPASNWIKPEDINFRVNLTIDDDN